MKFVAEIKKTDYGVIIKPVSGNDADELRKMKQNTQYKFDVKQPRNPRFHRLFMALMQLGYANQEQYNNFDHYRKVMIMKAGYYETIETSKGTIWLPLSISFDKMDESEFNEVYEKTLVVVAEQLQTAPQEIRNNLETYM